MEATIYIYIPGEAFKKGDITVEPFGWISHVNSYHAHRDHV